MHQPNHLSSTTSPCDSCEKLNNPQNNSYRYKLECSCTICNNCLTEYTLCNLWEKEDRICPVCLRDVSFVSPTPIKEVNVDKTLTRRGWQIRHESGDYYQSAVVENSMLVNNDEADTLWGKLIEYNKYPLIINEPVNRARHSRSEIDEIVERAVSVRDLFSGAISDCLRANHWNTDADSETDETWETYTNWGTETERSFVITLVELERKLEQFIDNMALQHACQLHHVHLNQFSAFQPPYGPATKERMLRTAREEFTQVDSLASYWHVMVATLVGLLALRHASRFHLEGTESQMVSNSLEAGTDENEDEDSLGGDEADFSDEEDDN
jgi:hypothetical protein